MQSTMGGSSMSASLVSHRWPLSNHHSRKIQCSKEIEYIEIFTSTDYHGISSVKMELAGQEQAKRPP